VVVLPLITGGFWLGSGREILTKPERAVEFEVKDELFGDFSSQTLLVAGPIFGYWVGFDAVLMTLFLSGGVLVSTGVSKKVRRRRLMLAAEH